MAYVCCPGRSLSSERRSGLSGLSPKCWCRLILAPTLLALFVGLLAVPNLARAKDLINQSLDGIAIQGYDTVAYFTDAKAMKGSDEFGYTWLGATWHFASAMHRDLFAADPVKYAPQYGGYCSSSMVDGSAYDADPEAWRIIEGKLYLNASKEWPSKWESDTAEEIERADSKWGVLKAHLTD
jgi:YHS domain-containing protein